MSAYWRVREIAAEQGWTDATIVHVLCNYIDNQASPDALEDYLLTVVDNERAEAGQCTACLHSEHYDDSCKETNCKCEA